MNLRELLKTPELSPCPFCGGSAAKRDHTTSGWVDGCFIECGNCGARTRAFTHGALLEYEPHSFSETNNLRAANAWNGRPGQGTFCCPVCGVGVPHTHKEKDGRNIIVVAPSMKATEREGT